MLQFYCISLAMDTIIIFFLQFVSIKINALIALTHISLTCTFTHIVTLKGEHSNCVYLLSAFFMLMGHFAFI